MPTKRRVIIAHGWNDGDKNAWINWLGDELEARGYEVIKPVFPHIHVPRPAEWVETLSQAVGTLDKNTVLVAYSLGVPTTLRFLSDYGEDTRLAGLILVAGFGDGPFQKPGVLFDPPLDFEAIKRRARNRVVIYSDNDYLIAPWRSQQLAENLEGREVVVVGGGHLTGLPILPGSRERIPAVLGAVLESFAGPRWWLGNTWYRLWGIRRHLRRPRA
jgi:uncharacterized protein